ncbi:hypothetical protein SHKM778_77900 [Streptomyces sp. KM77-8]|uniref:Uncharacterized protein n=1 Tax=Streptomyces haneummycinicus TaxID=3074435 RepID=A0AAT9HVZ3_9ACTN
MSENRPWYRSNRYLVGIMPAGVVGIAYAQTSLEGVAQNVVMGTCALMLLGFVFRVALNARAEKK